MLYGNVFHDVITLPLCCNYAGLALLHLYV